MTTPVMQPSAIYRDEMGLWHPTASGRLLVTPRVNEDILAHAFLKFKADKVDDNIWPAGGAPSLSWFLKNYSKENGVQVLACLKEDENQRMSPCGLSWISNRDVVANTVSRAEVGEGFFRGVSPLDTYWFGVMSLDYIFEDLGVDVVYGTTPAPNRAAVRYARSLGMQLYGPIPNYTTWKDKATGEYKPAGVWISAITKEQWAERTEKL